MSRWPALFSRRRGRPSGAARAARRPVAAPSGPGPRGVAALPPVEDIDGVLLVRSVDDDSFSMATLAEVAQAVRADEDIVTVMVGSVGAGPDHWARLGALLDSLRARGTARVRLVMSGAGDDHRDRPCVARRIADAWEVEVIAPDGAVLITPGGALFVHRDSGTGGGWWRFAPGEAPGKLGPRSPAPGWQEALSRVPTRTTGGCVVEQIPAGLVMRPAGAPGPDADDLCFAIPVDLERPTVMVGALHAEDVAPDEVAAVLAALPEAQRSRVRLAPGGRRDLLRLGQSVADTLGTEVEVLTGLPLLADHAPPGAAPRPTLLSADGRPGWQPFVTSVACGPADPQGRVPAPRLLGSSPPPWLPGGTEPGTVRLDDRWQATVTRAGLALWERDAPRPPLALLAVDPDTCAIELGVPGQPLDASLLPALSRLLVGLGPSVRARTTLLVRGRLTAGEGELRRLAAEHGVPGIRYVTAGRPGSPGPVSRRPGQAPRPSSGVTTASHPAGTVARGPLPTGAPAPLRPGAPAGAEVATGSAATASAPSPAAGPRPVPRAATPPERHTPAPAPTGRTSAIGGVPAGVPRPAAGGTAEGAAAGNAPGPGPSAARPGPSAGADSGGRTPSAPRTPARTPASALPRVVGAEPAAEPDTAARAAGASTRASGPVTAGDGSSGRLLAGGAASRGRPDGTPAHGTPGGGTPAHGDDTGAPDGAPGDDVVVAALAGRSGDPAPAARPARVTGSGEPGPAGGDEAESPDRGERAPRPARPERTGRPEGPAATPAPSAPTATAGTAPASNPVPRPVAAPTAVTAPAPPAPAPAPASAARAVPLPFLPGHISGTGERAAFRDFAAADWERHAAAVSRVLTRMPALRGHELEAARTDLIAAHAYLTAEEGPLHHRDLIRDIRTGEGRLLPYAGCLASALRRLPSYRGVALRGGDADTAVPRVGALLREPGPLSALAGVSKPPAGPPVSYAIWSVTGRKVRQLLDTPGGTREPHDEIVFVPGSGFRVLAVRPGPAGSSVVLLRELPRNANAYMDEAEELSQLDLKARSSLEEALDKDLPGGAGRTWPERCTGPVGQGG